MRRIRIYDTLSREIRLFAPRNPPMVGMFVCGLTPYAEAHVGHGKVAVFFDVVARALRRWGYRVFYVQNVTNVDDKVIRRGAEEGVDPLTLSEGNFISWRVQMERLGVRSVNYYPFATDYVPEIIAQIRQLVERGLAYEADGSVYYDVSSFPSYGKLSGQKVAELVAGARVEVDPYKRSPEDFVVWKAATPGEPTWESPWGPGRPGWHIEDTAITVKLLGARYDIHGAAVDLIFPHHEAEIAQAEGATGESPLVNYWMHIGLVLLSGEKMSKSVGNVFGLTEALDRNSPEVLRFFYLNAAYRSPQQFVPEESLHEASQAYATLTGSHTRLFQQLARSPGSRGQSLPESLETNARELVEKLDETLADDFNTREAIALLFGWGKVVQEAIANSEFSTEALETLSAPYRWGEEVLGLFGGPEGEGVSSNVSAFIDVAIAARQRARERGDFAEADRIRNDLLRSGVRLEDQGPQTRWEFVRPATDPE